MTSGRTFVTTTLGLGLVTLAHALVTWPIAATLALFGGGAAIAFVAEAVVVNLGWLEHHLGRTVAGAPLYVLFGWTGLTYLAFRTALLVTDGWVAVVAAGSLATAYDMLTDHRGVEEGYWTYLADLGGPRYRDVPWWNFAGWFAISCLTAAFARSFL